jgi:hypothetical protein
MMGKDRIAKFGAVLLMTLCVSCSHLPNKIDKTYGGFSQAHAVRAFSVGPISYVMAGSFVFGTDKRRPVFAHQPAALVGDEIRVAIFPSSGLKQQGLDGPIARDLASSLDQMLGSLSRYAEHPVPVDELQVYLVDRSTRLERRTRSLSMTRSHTIRLFLTYDADQPQISARRIARTLAHELFHVIVSIPRLTGKATEAGEQAANAIEHCVEVDVFGSTAAPRRIASIQRGARNDSTPTGISVMANYGSDPALDAVFSGKQIIKRSEATALHTLCTDRARQQLAIREN